MIPREAGKGSSFQGAGLYYLHDKDALTANRVAFVHCENLPTQEPNKALGWMAWTHHIAPELKRKAGVAAGGRQGTAQPVYTVTLAWHPEEKPDKAQMIEQGRAWLKAQGLQEHQVMMVAHKDRDHPHLHLIINRVHPTTGKVARMAYSKLKSSRYAQAFEESRGKVYCQQRVENNKERDQGKRVRYKEEQLKFKAYITQLYHAADSGRAFSAALKEFGMTMAKSKRIVLMDRDGKIYSLYRQLEGVDTKEAKAKLRDLSLPTVEQVQKERAGSREKAHKPQLRVEAAKVFDRDRQDKDWQEKVIDAGIADALRKIEERKAQAKINREERELRLRLPVKLVNELRARHEQEKERFRYDRQKRRDELEEKLERQYGPHQEKLKTEIADLEKRVRSQGARHLVRKVTGRQQRDEDSLAGKRKTLDNLLWRKVEAVQTLENKLAKQEEGLATRHRVEWRNLERAAAQQEAGGGRINYLQLKELVDRDQSAREAMRERDRQRGRERGHHY